MTTLRRGPSDPMPQSGMKHSSENRRKLIHHIDGTIALLEEAIKHARRALVRAKAERMRDWS